MNSEENPVNSETARHLLGQPDKPWSRGYMSAVKKKMGVKGRLIFPSAVRKFLRENPGFKVSDVYPRKEPKL